tara:strand:+ start:2670 stop:3380 length:711 start_codon:yes stop_codon:yes gene_type:complete
MDTTKKIIFFFLLLISSHSRGNENLLLKGDSLFELKKYVEAKEYYDILYFDKELYTNSMLLKLAFIENGLGNFEKSIFYLSKHKKEDDNEIIDQNLFNLVTENDLKTYDNSDYDYLLKIYKTNKQYIIIFLLTVLLTVFCLNIIRRKRNQKIKYIKTFFTLSVIIMLMINIKGAQEGIILNENTFIMNNPSSGSDVYQIIKKGEKIKIISESEVWYEVELENQRKYIRKKNILKID